MDLKKYQDHIDFGKVLSLTNEFSKGKLSLKEETELYAPLLELDEKKTMQTLALTLTQAETFLENLRLKPEIKEVVPGKVFFEVLKTGNGEIIKGTDPVNLQFKEYGIDGCLIKDTLEKTYAIPLSQTIKGFQLGLDGARIGETRKLYIHPDYGFGKQGRKGANKLLIYEVTITKLLNESYACAVLSKTAIISVSPGTLKDKVALNQVRAGRQQP